MRPSTRTFIAVALVIAAAVPAQAQKRSSRTPLLLGESFPVEVAVSSHAGLLHWLDSLTALNGLGMTAGKSIEAHRSEYNRRLGRLSPADQQVLVRYVEARKASVQRNNHGEPDALNHAFFQAGSMREAMDALPALLDADTATTLRTVLAHFRPHYQKIWNGGHVARAFLQRVNQDPRRAALADFLIDVAGFYGVEPVADPPPRVRDAMHGLRSTRVWRRPAPGRRPAPRAIRSCRPRRPRSAPRPENRRPAHRPRAG